MLKHGGKKRGRKRMGSYYELSWKSLRRTLTNGDCGTTSTIYWLSRLPFTSGARSIWTGPIGVMTARTGHASLPVEILRVNVNGAEE